MKAGTALISVCGDQAAAPAAKAALDHLPQGLGLTPKAEPDCIALNGAVPHSLVYKIKPVSGSNPVSKLGHHLFVNHPLERHDVRDQLIRGQPLPF